LVMIAGMIANSRSLTRKFWWHGERISSQTISPRAAARNERVVRTCGAR
jgi:hypothetical protein